MECICSPQELTISAEELTVYPCEMSEFTRVPKQEADDREWSFCSEVCCLQFI